MDSAEFVPQGLPLQHILNGLAGRKTLILSLGPSETHLCFAFSDHQLFLSHKHDTNAPMNFEGTSKCAECIGPLVHHISTARLDYYPIIQRRKLRLSHTERRTQDHTFTKVKGKLD